MATLQQIKINSYPAPPQLSTSTDLTPQQAEAVTEAVNVLIADSFTLYVKTKNYHWHLYGPHFRDYHLLFDEQAESIFESIDVMAERKRKIGGTTIKRKTQIGQLKTIKDKKRDLVTQEKRVRGLLVD